MSSAPFAGVYTALATPFLDDAVDWASLDRLLEHQIAGGVQGVVAVGTTGESPTLSHDEHIAVVRHVVERAAGRVTVLAGTGSNSTAEAVDLTRRAEAAGVDGFLIVAPYYNKPTQAGLFAHFARIAEVTAKPIMLYSIPGRCGIEISTGVAARLFREFPHIGALKEAGGSADRVSQLVQACGPDYAVLSGDDNLTLPMMAVGARGVVSVASNLLPRELTEMVARALRNDFEGARALHQRLYPLFGDLFIESNPAPVKWTLARAGLFASPAVRPPLGELQPASVERLAATLANLGQ